MTGSGQFQSPQPLAIRPATELDYGSISRIFHEAVRKTARADYTEEQVRAWSPQALPASHWQRRTAELQVKVAVIGKEVVGFIGFSQSGYLDLLFVQPGFTKQGVGRQLLAAAEEHLRRAGVKLAWTEASRTAQPFFSKMGYEFVRDQTVLCNGVALQNARMEKTFPSPARTTSDRQPG